MVFQSQPRQTFCTQQLEIIFLCMDVLHPPFQPTCKYLGCFAVRTVINESLVIPVIESGNRRRMRSPGRVHNCTHKKTGGNHPVGIAVDDIRRYNLFGGNDDVSTGQTGFASYAQISPYMRVSEFICALSMNYGNIRIYSGDGCEGIPAKGADNSF